VVRANAPWEPIVDKPAFVIRSLQHGEWSLLKALRLRALHSDPESFWESADDVGNHEDAYWNAFARKLTSPDGSRLFILESGEAIIGMVFGVVKEGAAYRVGGLWVDPAQRGKGYGTRLVQHVIAWARTRPDAQIQLWCPSGSTMHFYQRNGFHSLERYRTNEADGRQIVEMQWRGE
jgi:GNAT superfamily N-acetyltransferase